MRKALSRFVSEESNTTVAEYLLLFAIIGAGIAVGAGYVSGNIAHAMKDAGDRICTAAPYGSTICGSSGQG